MNRFARRETLGLLAGGTASLAMPASFRGEQGGAQPALFFNGDILTMEGDAPSYVEALVEQGGRIAFVGSLREARRRFPAARKHNLAGSTLLPGFIDGHGHYYITGLTGLMANVLPLPDGPAASFDSLVASTKAWMDSVAGRMFIKTFGWIVANGYDDAQLREGRHPDATVLDRISTDLPVLAIHQSGHVGCLNTRGLADVGFGRDTPDPAGGHIRRSGDGLPDGLVEEAAYTVVAFRILSKTTPAIERACLDAAQQAYVAGGYTTAQEARAMPNMSRALELAAADNALGIDVVAYPDIVANAAALANGEIMVDGAYRGRYRIGGAKLSLDGSPQAKTAWLSAPYHVPPHGQGPDYRGYPAMPDEKVGELVGQASTNGWQLACHANGDAAIDQFLDAIEAAPPRQGWDRLRPVLIHGQTLRRDQVLRMAQLRVAASLFPAHTFYWGDHHRQSVLGPQRADRISPCREVLNAGINLTSHHDAPVVRPDAMRILDATVNRTTRTGVVLGADQRLTPYEGLRALTAWAAFQIHEEATKGTLVRGKLADLVILSANPLKVAPAEIHRIQVVKLFKEGRPLPLAA